MKTLGIILIVIGILMFLFGNINFTRKEKVVDVGPIEITKKEKKTIEWPNYAGAVAVVAGAIILLTAGKQRKG